MASLLRKTMGLSLFLVLVSLKLSFGAVYEVGDDKGWTVNDKSYYTGWAKSKKFHVGDVLLFRYDKQIHNVVQVDKKGYHKCNAAKPIAGFNTGHDSVTIRSDEHLYFICGTPGHCEAGQKLRIKVSRSKVPVVEPPPPINQASFARGGSCPLLLCIVILVIGLF
ncbi:mavicyanin-like [Phalaenopsis equestris]|uniref:mavicyanin-like n=1 Tax=Phalaenopsis equestris TaxID=78828 RepID=UPI0009E4B119|nr:mavicyanin-like [Phalaenopsis equestris]